MFNAHARHAASPQPATFTGRLKTLIAAAALAMMLSSSVIAAQQGTAFNYQGVLKSGSSPYNGTADFEFRLFDSAGGATQIGAMIPVSGATLTDGLFATPLDFGALAFAGDERWLEIRVRTPTGGAGGFTILAPRQKVASMPYASFALKSALAGSYASAVNFTNAGNTFTGAFSGSGAGLTGISPSSLTAGTASINITGNAANANFATSAQTASNAVNVTGTVGIANGGTGANNASSARSNLGAAPVIHTHSAADIASGALDAARLPNGGAWTLGTNLNVDSNTLVIDSFANTVGIGTNAPADRLHVAGGLSIEGSDHVYMQFYPDGYAAGRKGWIGWGAALDNNLTITNQITDAHILLLPSGPSGRVGVGITTPATTLDVAGTGRFNSSLVVQQPGAGTEGGQIVLGDAGTTMTGQAPGSWNIDVVGTTTPELRFFRHGSGPTMEMTDGAVGIGAGPVQEQLRVVTGSQPYAATVYSVFSPPANWLIAGAYAAATGSGAGSNAGLQAVASGAAQFNYGLKADASNDGAQAYGVYARVWGGGGYGVYSYGDASVVGTLSKTGGAFRIDHPLDPENKELWHSFVESPDMMNLYNGNVRTDGAGYAIIELPAYFEALNRDFRYQLTVLDEDDSDHFVMAKVVRKIEGNQFTIRTSVPFTEVSWLVTGVRQDAWAQANRIPNEVDKRAEDRGFYLNPEAFGQSLEKGVDWRHSPEAFETTFKSPPSAAQRP